MASARYGYTTVTPSDRPLKRPYASTINTPPATKVSTTAPPSADLPDVFYSSPIHDRKSTFQALFSPSLPPKDLQSLASIASASHKILAYRIPTDAPLSSSTTAKRQRQSVVTSSFKPAQATSDGRTLTGGRTPGGAGVQTGKDDDGKNHGGRAVLKVLESERLPGGGGIVGSCVVARWYGGVMLGPVRFTHMEDCAREAVGTYCASLLGGSRVDKTTGAAGITADGEKTALVDQEQERVELVAELERRDESIVSLRRLLETKRTLLESLEGKSHSGGGPASSSDPAVPRSAAPQSSVSIAQVQDGSGKSAGSGGSGGSPAKKIDYAAVPLVRLRALDQARDKTLGFLLGQIDSVEAQVASWEGMFDELDDDETTNAAT